MLAFERSSLVLFLVLIAGCFAESSPTETRCTPGTQISCDCFKSDGVQVCRISGDGYEPCQCGGEATDGPDTGDSATATTDASTTDSMSSSGADADTTATATTTTSTTDGGMMTGDPGTTTGSVMSDIVINELVHDPVSGQEDWIELYNRGEEAVDVSDWAISDGGNFLAIAPGTTLEPNDYLVYTRNEPGSFSWGFGDDEVAVLYDAEGQIVDSADWQLGEAVEPDSFGRLPNGSGPFTELTPTKGGPNE